MCSTFLLLFVFREAGCGNSDRTGDVRKEQLGDRETGLGCGDNIQSVVDLRVTLNTLKLTLSISHCHCVLSQTFPVACLLKDIACSFFIFMAVT